MVRRGDIVLLHFYKVLKFLYKKNIHKLYSIFPPKKQNPEKLYVYLWKRELFVERMREYWIEKEVLPALILIENEITILICFYFSKNHVCASNKILSCSLRNNNNNITIRNNFQNVSHDNFLLFF